MSSATVVEESVFLNAVQPNGHYMNREFYMQQLQVLLSQRIYVFCVDLRINSDYFLYSIN